MPATHNNTGRARKTSGDIHVAPGAPSTTRRYRRKNKIMEQFAARTIRMLESPAFRVLSLSARRILDRLEIELAHHGGHDNGQLPVTYRDFVEYGMDRDAIAPAIRECVELGFVELTEQGRAGNAEFRAPNRFRLTYKPTEYASATDEWARIKTVGQAESLARTARAVRKKQKPSRGKSYISVGETPIQTQNSRSGNSRLQA